MIRYILAILILFAAATALAKPTNNLLPADRVHSMNFVSMQGNDLAPGVDPASVPPAPYRADPAPVVLEQGCAGNAAGCSGSSYSSCSGSSSGCSGSSRAMYGGRRLFGRFRLFRARGCS